MRRRRSLEELSQRAVAALERAEEREEPDLFDLQRSREATRELLRRSEQLTEGERETVRRLFTGNQALQARLAEGGAGLTWAASEVVGESPEIGEAILATGQEHAARARRRVIRAWRHAVRTGTDPTEQALRAVRLEGAEEAVTLTLAELAERHQREVARPEREYLLVAPWITRYASGGESALAVSVVAHRIAELEEPTPTRWRAQRGTLLLAPPAVAEVLRRRWGREVVEVGPAHPDDTEATVETMVRLLETSEGELAQPAAALEAARLLTSRKGVEDPRGEEEVAEGTSPVA